MMPTLQPSNGRKAFEALEPIMANVLKNVEQSLIQLEAIGLLPPPPESASNVSSVSSPHLKSVTVIPRLPSPGEAPTLTAKPTVTKCVFISHSSKDKLFAEKLGAMLRARGYQVWLDKWNIKVGQSIISEIEKGLERADYVALVLTEHSVGSNWVDREWKTILWQQMRSNKTHILPVLLEDCQIPTMLQGIKYANFKNTFEDGLSELLDAMTDEVQ